MQKYAEGFSQSETMLGLRDGRGAERKLK